MERISPLTEVKQINIVDYLSKIGYEPIKKEKQFLLVFISVKE